MARAERSAPVQRGEVLAGKYRVERILGAGGMGVVVLAKHLDLGAPVAIKFLLPEVLGDEDVVARFSREARAMFRLRSEHVARVLDVGKLPNGAPYMVMEYLDGSDLAGVLHKRKMLDVDEAVTYVLQACEAVAEAHSMGVVHRDIKPQNLFLTLKVDGTAHVKVLDFGISKMLDNSGEHMKMTHSSVVMGSPSYMSPEQLRASGSAGKATDIWALGIVLYELLTGTIPFIAESAPALYAMLLEETARSPHLLRAEIPIDLASVILRCLERKPENRFASVADLAAALEPFAPASMSGAGKRVAAVRGRELPPKSVSISPEAATESRYAITEVNTGISWEGTDPSKRKQRTRLLVAGGAALLGSGALLVLIHSLLAAPPALPITAATVEGPFFDAGSGTGTGTGSGTGTGAGGAVVGTGVGTGVEPLPTFVAGGGPSTAPRPKLPASAGGAKPHTPPRPSAIAPKLTPEEEARSNRNWGKP
jgi:serine/threonine protein kinase